MTDENRTELPLETTVGAAGSHATEAFALLADETRLAILLALWEEYDPHATDNIVSFSEIFDRVDYEDPGSFSYHLQQLSGQFIRQYADGEGYELRVPALRFIHAVIAGAGVQDETLETTEIKQPCPFCDAPTAISYEEGLVIHVCTECDGVTTEGNVPGHLSAVPFDPAGLTDRIPEEIRAASRVAAWRQTQIMFDGLCPACSGPVESWLECCTDHESSGICDHCGARFASMSRFECRTCKNYNISSLKALAMFHPTVTAFYEERDISTRVHAEDVESVRRVFDLMDAHKVDVITEDPPPSRGHGHQFWRGDTTRVRRYGQCRRSTPLSLQTLSNLYPIPPVVLIQTCQKFFCNVIQIILIAIPLVHTSASSRPRDDTRDRGDMSTMASTQEENAALIRVFLTTIVAGGDTDALGIFLSGDRVDCQPVVDNRVDSNPVGAGYWSALAAADLDITIDDIVAADEKVAVRGTVTGIHREPVLDGVPTGRSFGIAIVWFCRIENGQILKTWSLPTEAWLVRQLDAPLGGT